MIMDVLTEKVMKEVPDPMVFAYDVVLCGSNGVDMTEYLESWRKSLEESDMNVRHAVKKHSGCTKVRASGKGVISRCISQGDCDRT